MTHKIILASGNAGKVQEFQALLAPQDIEIVPQSSFDIPAAIEAGLTFVENAIIKARHAAQLTGLPALADDSGLEVDYLNGAPGIYSSRFAGEDCSDQQNYKKLLQLMEKAEDYQRSARFQCLLVFMRHWQDPTPIICQGSWEGTITSEPQGTHGFGYDPVFFVPEQQCTSAQLPKQLKNTLSHRAKAMSMLIDMKLFEKKIVA